MLSPTVERVLHRSRINLADLRLHDLDEGDQNEVLGGHPRDADHPFPG